MNAISAVTDAVVLMAGAGSRLRSRGRKLPKPLVSVLGRPLISYTFDALRHAGIRNVYAVVGFEKDAVEREVAQLAPPDLQVRFVDNPEWQKQNGVSVLAAAPHVGAPFLLTMSDHLYDQAILDLLIGGEVIEPLSLAVDRKLDSIFDPDDAMKVQTRGDRLLNLGKELTKFDAIDTGVFVCTSALFDHLERARSQSDGDCSLADGVRSMAAAGIARAVDIGEAWWQDVDTEEMLACAEDRLRARLAIAERVQT